MLQPGTVAYVTCDWQVPQDKEQVQFRAIIDRGLEIDEGQEDNNVGVLAVAIEPALSTSSEQSSSSQLSDGMFWSLTVLALFAIAGVFIYLTPAKIKKLE